MSDVIGEVVTLMVMAAALGMDAFSVGLGMGMYKLRLKRIFVIGLSIGLFHVLMPLAGISAGKFLSEKFGSFASLIGGLLLILLGLQMIWSSFKSEEEKVITPVGFGLLIFALSVSLDSFSVGLTLGIYGTKTVLVLLCFGIAATTLTWAGLLLGKKVRGWMGVYSEALGGAILLAFGIKLMAILW
ncbi:manganese efflux pump MntP family protein [Neobacillus muris]|uniref:manganese efflux pump MntP n=1 Tax=Neobacillus muris TaxID=2941334 RepID=UPI00203C88E1|nr:manganese efflux pump MntP family protein [Neobacillus muris]